MERKLHVILVVPSTNSTLGLFAPSVNHTNTRYYYIQVAITSWFIYPPYNLSYNWYDISIKKLVFSTSKQYKILLINSKLMPPGSKGHEYLETCWTLWFFGGFFFLLLYHNAMYRRLSRCTGASLTIKKKIWNKITIGLAYAWAQNKKFPGEGGGGPRDELFRGRRSEFQFSRRRPDPSPDLSKSAHVSHIIFL